MERTALQNLQHWKQDPHCKPLLLKDVRQVGKTWLLKEFGRRAYKNGTYFNFDETRNSAGSSRRRNSPVG